MKNILITGITGFIGSSVAKHLKSLGFNIFGLSSSKKKLTGFEVFDIDSSKKDLGIDDLFAEKNFDLVIHLASFSDYSNEEENIHNYISANIEFPTKILNLMKKHACYGFINTSSYWQYNPKGEYEANTLYAATKTAFNQILDYYAKTSPIKYIDLVLYDVYSLNDTRKKLINILAEKSNQKEKFSMTEAKQLLSFVHVDDLVKAYALALEQIETNEKINQSYFLHSSCKKELRTYIETFLSVNKSKLEIEFGTKSYPKHQLMDIYLGEVLPKWLAGINIEEGFKID